MQAPLPGWVGPTMAISLVVIALAFAAIGAVSVMLGLTAKRQISELSNKVTALRNDLQGVVDSAKHLAATGQELSSDLREECQHYLATSRTIRQDLERGVRRVKSRLADLDALYEVVHEEVEDTALDVAAKVRTVRQGAGMVGRLRRWLVRGRR